MKIEFKKNIQFTRLIKADGQLREFNFRKINSPGDGLFSVDVSDDRGNRKMFKMEKDQNAWRLQDGEQFPDWIIKNEGLLNEMILEELQRKD